MPNYKHDILYLSVLNGSSFLFSFMCSCNTFHLLFHSLFFFHLLMIPAFSRGYILLNNIHHKLSFLDLTQPENNKSVPLKNIKLKKVHKIIFV